MPSHFFFFWGGGRNAPLFSTMRDMLDSQSYPLHPFNYFCNTPLTDQKFENVKDLVVFSLEHSLIPTFFLVFHKASTIFN